MTNPAPTSVWPLIWDGSTEQRPATAYRSPNAQDWEQLLAELRADRHNIIRNQFINYDTGLPNGTPISSTASGLVAADYVTNPLTIGIVEGTVIKVSGAFLTENLIPGSIYYLGNQEITTMPPETGWLVEIGVALDAATLLLNIRRPIRL